MSNDFLVCKFCDYKISETTEWCQHCGNYITEEYVIEQKNSKKFQKLQSYQELRQEMESYKIVEKELSELNNQKNSFLSQINAIDLEIKNNLTQINELKSKKKDYRSKSSIFGLVSKIINRKKITRINNQIHEINANIDSKKSKKKDLQSKFYQCLEEVEELQEYQTLKTAKLKLFEEIKSNLAEEITDQRELQLRSQIDSIQNSLKTKDEVLNELNSALNLVDEALNLYVDLTTRLSSLSELPDTKKGLFSETKKKSEQIKLRNDAKNIDKKLNETYLVLEGIQGHFSDVDDFEVLVKYLRSYLKDVQTKFKIDKRMQADLDISYSHGLKVKVWVERYINIAKEQIKTLESELSESKEKLNAIITELVNNYVDHEMSGTI